jgi:hypothetical protein
MIMMAGPTLTLFGIAIALMAIATGTAVLHPAPSATGWRKRDAAPSRRVVGGVMWSVLGLPWRVTAPLACMEIFEDGVRVGPNGKPLAMIVPRWDFRWADLGSVSAEAGRLALQPVSSNTVLRFLVLSSGVRDEVLSDLSHRLAEANRC